MVRGKEKGGVRFTDVCLFAYIHLITVSSLFHNHHGTTNLINLIFIS